jgi:gliding motility-associated-like protein
MKIILNLLMSVLWCVSANATHIVGGIMSVEHIAGSQYKISLRVYRDCLNGEAQFDNPASVGIFDKNTNDLLENYNLPLIKQEVLPFAAASCDNSLPIGCTDMGLYELMVELDPNVFANKGGYYLSYQRCCRNGIIQNLRDPGEAGITIYAEIPSPKELINSSPNISQNPNVLLCKDLLTTYNFGFKDADGDVLKYSMTTPIRGTLTRSNPKEDIPSNGPYPLTNWVGGYSTASEITGSPSLSINPATGQINVSPSQTGTFAIAIKVEEFRQNKKIGEVILELQVNVAACFQPTPTLAVKDSINQALKNKFSVIETPHSACYYITAEDPKDSLYLDIQNISADSTLFPKPVFTSKLSGLKKVTTRICWDAACSLPLNSTQTLKITVTDNGCPKFSSVSYELRLQSIPLPNHNPVDLLCMTLADEKQTTLYWGDSTPMSTYFNHYNLYRRVNGGPFVLLDSIPDKHTRFYTDPNTPNYTTNNYEYMIRSVNQCGNIGLPSDTLGTFEQLKFIPDKQQIISVSVANNRSIDITWPKTWEKDFAQYFIYKKEAQDPVYKLIHQTALINDTIFRDPNVDVSSKSYCYHIIMKDTCDNYGPVGFEACSILLDGEASPFENSLQWNGYNWWYNGVDVYELNSQGDKMESPNVYIVSNTDSSFTDNQLDQHSGLFSYWVVARQQNTPSTAPGKTGPIPFYNAWSVSNTIELSQKPNVFVPNAFTPNSDQLNDTWNIRDIFVKDYKLTVYNKWGQAIFTTTDKNNKWTGKLSSGTEAPSDVYIYLLTYTGYDNSNLTLKGNVTILR